MKLVKLLTVAALSAAALVQSSFASNEASTVYVTGSTAYRKAALAAITAIYDSAPVQINDSANATSVANNTNNTTYLFSGLISGSQTYIACTFTGAVDGCWAVSGSKSIPFLFDAAATTYASNTTGAPSAYTSSDSDSASINTDPSINMAIADMDFNDVYQNSTIYSNSAVITTDDGATTTYKTLTDTIVGIITFKWVGSFGFPLGTGSGGVSSYSVTSRFANYICQNGIAQLSLMTGHTADQNTEIYLTGRNPYSGTRATTLIETNYGETKPVQQYKATGLSGSAVTGLQLWPASNGFIAGASVATGNNGAGSGADVRPYLGYTIPTSASVTGKNPTACYFLSYLGISDATTVLTQSAGGSVAGPATELLHNGVQYSASAVYNGQYTYWGYEHLCHRTTGFSGLPSTIYSKLTAYLTSAANVTTINGFNAGIAIADPGMLVKRTTDGAAVVPASNFPY